MKNTVKIMKGSETIEINRSQITLNPYNPKRHTDEQVIAMVLLVRRLCNVFDIKPENIYGHNDFTSKACPCFNVKQWLEEAGVFAPHFMKTNSKTI